MVDRPGGFLTLKGLRLGVTGEADEIFLCSDDISYFTGNLSISGNLTANTVTTGGGGINDLCFPVGIPAGIPNNRPLYLTNTTFTNNIGLNLTPAVLGCDAFQLLDKYWDTYYYDTPPAPILVSTNASGSIQIVWQNTPTIQSAILNTAVPHVIELRIDFILSSQNIGATWSNPFVTINTGYKLTNTVNFYTTGSGSGLSGTVWDQYTITSGVSYDFRIYGVNYATGTRTTKYLTVLNLTTNSVGVPSAVIAPTSSSETTSSVLETWTKPTDHDDVITGDNTTPIISSYRIESIPASTQRYPGLFNNTILINNTPSTSSPTNSNTSITLGSLLPGTSYNTYVSARNELNPLYGPTGSNVIQTLIPNAPALLPTSSAGSILNIATLITPYSVNGGYSLDGTVVASPIINTSNATTIRSVSTPTFRLNNTAGSTNTNVASISGNAGLTSSFDIATSTINGYPLNTSASTTSNGKSTLNITSESDTYSGSSAGFWKTASVYVQTTGLTPNVNSYSFSLNYTSNQGAGSVNTTPVTFYSDNLNNVPVIAESGIISEDTNGYRYISGIPTFNSNATFKTQFNITDIANKFLRHDKTHAIIDLIGTTSFSDKVFIKQSDIGVTYKYYNSTGTTTTSTSLHNTSGLVLVESPGPIQFNNFIITLGSTSLNKYTEDLTLRTVGANLYGTSVGVTSRTLTGKPIRVDTRSINVLDNLVGVTQVCSGNGPYPDLGTNINDAGELYDHTQSLLVTNELQLVNGYYQPPTIGTGYKDYTNYYFPGSPVLRDYSSIIPNTDYRYTTFKIRGVDIGIPVSTTREKLRVVLNGMVGLNAALATVGSQNHSMEVRVVDTVDTTTDGWCDMTNTISPVGILTGTNGTPVLNSTTSTNSQRDTYIRNGTTSSAIIYIRIGIPSNLNAYFRDISVTALQNFN